MYFSLFTVKSSFLNYDDLKYAVAIGSWSKYVIWAKINNSLSLLVFHLEKNVK